MIKVNSERKLTNRNGKRRGFTMVELVISLTVIAIVTLATVSIINAQHRIYTLTSQTAEATNITENAIECFRYAANISDDEEVVKNEFYNAFKETGYLNTEQYPESASYYEITKNGLKINIGVSSNQITIVSYDSWGDQILDETYTK